MGGTAPDRLMGGDDNDLVSASGDNARDTILCGAGADTAYYDARDQFEDASGAIVTAGASDCETLILQP